MDMHGCMSVCTYACLYVCMHVLGVNARAQLQVRWPEERAMASKCNDCQNPEKYKSKKSFMNDDQVDVEMRKNYN